MLETGDALRLVLAALGLGVALPIMIQLYLLIRDLRQSVRELQPSLQLLHDLARQRAAPESSGSQMAALIAAVIPALSAGFRAFRQHQAHTEPGRECPATRESEEPQ